MQTPSPIQSRRQSRGHEQERTRRRRRAASPRSAPAPARNSASAESARYHKKMSNSSLAIRRSTRPRAAAAPRADALATIRRVFVDADVEGNDPSFCVYPTFTAPDALDWHPSGPRAERPGRTTGHSGRRRRDVQHYCITAFGSRLRACLAKEGAVRRVGSDRDPT